MKLWTTLKATLHYNNQRRIKCLSYTLVNGYHKRFSNAFHIFNHTTIINGHCHFLFAARKSPDLVTLNYNCECIEIICVYKYNHYMFTHT